LQIPVTLERVTNLFGPLYKYVWTTKQIQLDQALAEQVRIFFIAMYREALNSNKKSRFVAANLPVMG
jgi:hypothetical protein